MDLSTFNTLSEKQKAYAVWDGTCVAFRVESDIVIKLYSVGSFFVEAFYCTDDKMILGFSACKAAALPDIYVEQFELDQIF